MTRYPCIIPSVPTDYERTKIHFNRFFEMLPVSELIFVGPESLENKIKDDLSAGLYNDNRLSFICENDLIPFSNVQKTYASLIAKSDSTLPPSSVNWYYQQFLKMAYSQVCETDYYICWDSDTLPLKKTKMISDNGKPYFDTKPENNSSYFQTIEKLLGRSKIIKNSFISEHMIFNKKLMSELINLINDTSFVGDYFYDKIFSAIGPNNLSLGFSEFETYGTFVGLHHPTAYMLRDWKSFRNLSFFINISDITEDDMQWLARDYDAATFEKYQETEPMLTDLFKNKRYREKLSPKQFYTTILESGAMGEYSNGCIKVNNNYYPV